MSNQEFWNEVNEMDNETFLRFVTAMLDRYEDEFVSGLEQVFKESGLGNKEEGK